MPLMIENGCITRITFDRPVAEQPLRERHFHNLISALWRLLSGD